MAPIVAPDAGEPRLTLTGRVILRARAIALEIQGEAKLATFAKALAKDPRKRCPFAPCCGGRPIGSPCSARSRPDADGVAPVARGSINAGRRFHVFTNGHPPFSNGRKASSGLIVATSWK